MEPAAPSLPLGLASLGTVPREVITVPFAPDDQMLFYTDGVSEARNRAGEFYPLPDRAVYAEATDPDSALNRLQEDVLLHPGDMLFVPKNTLSKIDKFFPTASMGTFFRPY